MFQLLMFRAKQRKDKAMQENQPFSLILASGSATRAKLLQAAGVKFQVDISNLDEDVIKREGADLAPEDLAILLARRKAQHVASRHPGKFVLGADQILVCDGQRFDKPPDIETLRQQLLSLRGRAHVLISALSIERAGAQVWSCCEKAHLQVRSFSDDFLDSYLEQEDKDGAFRAVGGYRLEGMGAQLFDRISGDFFTVLGLPLLPLLSFLRDQEILKE